MSFTISVLMSVRDGAAFLDSAIRSLEAQTEAAFECLVMDDGSRDATPEILRAWQRRDARVRLFARAEPAGLTASLRELLPNAQAPYLARQDADDLSSPDRFAHQKQFLDGHPEVALVGCAYNLIDEQGVPLDRIAPPVEPDELAALLRRRNVLAHGSWLARRADVIEAGGYRSAFRYAQDYDLLLRLRERGRLACLPETLYQLRLAASSVTASKRAAQQYFAEAAREAAALRSRGQSDEEFVKHLEPPAKEASDPVEGERFVTLLKALHAVKRGDVAAARVHLRELPWNYSPGRAFLLRGLCCLPAAWRERMFRRPRARAFLS